MCAFAHLSCGTPHTQGLGARLEGGEPGECGENWVRRNDGRMERLQGCDQTVLDPGEAVIIKTPTGGGFGKA